MKRFFIEKLTTEGQPSGQVDEVDQFVFDNRNHIVQNNGRNRYSNSHATLDGNVVDIQFQGNPALLANFARLFNVPTNQAVTCFCDEPETVVINKKNRKPVLYNVVDKTMWKMV